MAALGCCCPLQKTSAAGSWPGSTGLTQCLEEPGQAGISLPCCHLLPTLPLSLFLTPFPSGALSCSPGLFLRGVSAQEEPRGSLGCLRGQKSQDWVRGRRRRTPQGEIHVPNPLFDDLGAIIPFPLSSQGGHQEVEGFLSCRKKEVMTLIPPGESPVWVKWFGGDGSRAWAPLSAGKGSFPAAPAASPCSCQHKAAILNSSPTLRAVNSLLTPNLHPGIPIKAPS